jgi:glutathione S-transferase
LKRALHRAWIEYGSSILNDIWSFYTAPDEAVFMAKRQTLGDKLSWLERRMGHGPWFDGATLSLVDVVFGPVFRYFDVFDEIAEFGLLSATPKLASWRAALAERSSIRDAVTPDYAERLWSFLLARKSHLSRLMPEARAMVRA